MKYNIEKGGDYLTIIRGIGKNLDERDYWGNRFVWKINLWTAMDIVIFVCVISGFSGSIPITNTLYFSFLFIVLKEGM